jgi:predicted nucleic acid-binding protein
MVDFLRGRRTAKTKALDDACEMNAPLGISAYTYMELLSGARDGREFEKLRKALGLYAIYYLPDSEERYSAAARLYFDLRRKGITPRSMIDVLIARTAIEYDLYLLHDDRDFDRIAPGVAGLKTWPR